MRTGRAFSAGSAIGLRPADLLIDESEVERNSVRSVEVRGNSDKSLSLPAAAESFIVATCARAGLGALFSVGLKVAFAIAGVAVSDAGCEGAGRGRSNAANVKFERSPRISRNSRS